MTPSVTTWSAGFSSPPWGRAPYGMGDAQEAQYTKLATSAASTGVSIAASPAFALIGPLAATGIGLALVGVGIALELLFTRKGPQQKIDATKYADAAEPILRDNMNLYLAQPKRTVSMRAGALANFDQTWARLLQLCGDPKLGDAGKRCISERQAGGVAPWCDKPGHVGCDWFALYRNPIANDPDVLPDSALDKVVNVLTGGSSGPGGTASPGLTMLQQSVAPNSKVGLFVGLALLVGVLAVVSSD